MTWAKRVARTEWLLLQRVARIGGHSVSAAWLWAVQWILGVFGIVWALSIGVFVSLGGAEHLTGELYQPLVEAFRDFRVIGAVIITGGVLGVIGLARDMRRVSVASALICAVWNGLMALFTFPANWAVPGGGNLLCFYAAFVTVVYLMRFVLLTADPGDDPVKLR